MNSEYVFRNYMELPCDEASYNYSIPPQTNGHVGRYNRTLIVIPSHYVAEHRRSWDIFVWPLTYEHNTQVNQSTKKSLFSLPLWKHLLVLTTSNGPSSIQTGARNTTTPAFIQLKLLHLIAVMQYQTDKKLADAHGRYKDHYDRCNRATNISIPGWGGFFDRLRFAVGAAD